MGIEGGGVKGGGYKSKPGEGPLVDPAVVYTTFLESDAPDIKSPERPDFGLHGASS